MKDHSPTRIKLADAQPASSQGNGLSPRQAGVRSRQSSKPRPTRERGPKFLAEAYGLSENPFGVTPDPRYLYESHTHLEAKSSLVVGIECAVGFQALIAPPGMGKTTLLCNILEQFDDIARTAFLFQTQGNSRDFLRYLISELGGEAPESDLVRMQETINQLLISERRAGRQTIVIIDEAQNLAPAVLETLRLLSNFETSTDKLLHIILAGQPQLAQKLASPEAAQLSQRICILTTLEAFDLEDTGKYIEHRLKVAGYQGPPLFSPEAVTAIWKRSGGIPREINKVCFNSLLLARATKQNRVDSPILREVTSDIDLQRVQSRKPLRLNQMLRTEAAPQSGNEIVEGLAARIDRLCDDSGSRAVTRAVTQVEKHTDNKYLAGSVAPNPVDQEPAPEADAATTVSTPPEEVIAKSMEIPALAIESAADSAPHTEPVTSEDDIAARALEPATEIAGDSTEDTAPTQIAAKVPEPAAETATDLLEKSALGEDEDKDEDNDTEIFECHAEAADESTEESDETEFDFFDDADAAAGVSLLEPQDLDSVPWTTMWLNQQWRARRATVYLGLSAFVLLVALFWAPHSPPKSGNANALSSPVTTSENSPAAPDPAVSFPPPDYRPKARVWLDVQTQLYYCPGSPMYGTTQGGKFSTQQAAHLRRFTPASEFCQ